MSDSAEGYLDKKYSEKSILSIREAKEDDEGRYSESHSQQVYNESNMTSFGEYLKRQQEEEARGRKKSKLKPKENMVQNIYKKKYRAKIKLKATQRC